MERENSQKSDLPPCIIVTGPTASGKSAYALRLAAKHNGAIINADVMQLYRSFPVLTAQPDAVDRAHCPHALYSVLAPDQWCNAQKWCDMARIEINHAVERGQTPIVTGGTGFYILALLNGIASMPDVPAATRQDITAKLAEKGHVILHEELKAVDPVSAAKIKVNDTQRLIRALEVFAFTKKPLSQWHLEQTITPDRNYNFSVHLLQPPREVLYNNINQRTYKMLDHGALDEIRACPNIQPEWPTYKTHGYREFSAYLKGELTRDEAIEKTQQVTRNYAKRQTTWGRHQMTAEKLGVPVDRV